MPDVNVNDSAVKLIFSCCGAADVGEIADLATRRLHKESAGKMYCLTGIGAGLQNFIDTTKGAAKVVAVDGCAVDCTKKLLEKHGITTFEYLRVTDMGMEKGKSPVTEQAVAVVADKMRGLLNGVPA